MILNNQIRNSLVQAYSNLRYSQAEKNDAVLSKQIIDTHKAEILEAYELILKVPTWIPCYSESFRRHLMKNIEHYTIQHFKKDIEGWSVFESYVQTCKIVDQAIKDSDTIEQVCKTLGLKVVSMPVDTFLPE